MMIETLKQLQELLIQLSLLVGLLNNPIPSDNLGGVNFGAINPYKETATAFEIQKNKGEEGFEKTTFAKNRPEMILGKWNNEVQLKISYPKINKAGKRKPLSDRIEWQGVNEKVVAYPIAATSTMEEGGYEFEIELASKPATNVFDFTIEGAENLDFFYQPPLTAEEIAEGNYRPENVVGSYAVYHKTKANHKVGSTNYKTGKAFHIYRPKAIDANGNEIWAELNYLNGILSVKVPQSFLDTAVYPVIIDPTLGYTSVGGSTRTVIGLLDQMRGSNINNVASSNGTISEIRWYGKSELGGTNNGKTALYLQSDSSLLSPQSGAQSISTTIQWWIFTFTGPNISSGVAYIPVFFIDASFIHYYDTGISGNSKVQLSLTYPTFPNPAIFSNSADKYSIYATYTASGGAVSPPVKRYIIIE